MRADNPAPFLRGWIDKYGEIMRFAGLDAEVIETFHVRLTLRFIQILGLILILQILTNHNLINVKTSFNASKYWNRHMRYYRRMKNKSLADDGNWSDAEEFVASGAIRLKEFERGGREFEELQERKRARMEGREPVLAPEKYSIGMNLASSS